MKSYLSGLEYKLGNPKSVQQFYEELKKYNISLEQYAEKYFKNVSHDKNKRDLKPGEKYYYKHISLRFQTFEKIITNENYKCELCSKYCGSKSTFISHIKRHHKISYDDYFKKAGYKDLTNLSDYKSCAICKKEAEYNIEYDVINKTFKRVYPRFFCNSLECKEEICQRLFHKSYNESKKDYDHIGGNNDYLCIIHNTDKDGLKKICKSHVAKNPHNFAFTLDNCIKKWGIDLGTKKYYERNRKIVYARSLQGYIEKYGQEIGTQKYIQRLEKVTNYQKNNKNRISVGQLTLFQNLSKFANYELEYHTKCGIVDIYDKQNNVIVEYYGDYWHCNPILYKNDYYNQSLDMTAEEKHKFDMNRINNIITELNCKKVIIVWENSFKTTNISIIIDQINTFLKSNKEGILWI